MINISKLILGMLFVFGLTSMSDTNATAEKPDKELKKIPCVYVYDVCDTVFPDSHQGFSNCMDVNGC